MIGYQTSYIAVDTHTKLFQHSSSSITPKSAEGKIHNLQNAMSVLLTGTETILIIHPRVQKANTDLAQRLRLPT